MATSGEWVFCMRSLVYSGPTPTTTNHNYVGVLTVLRASLVWSCYPVFKCVTLILPTYMTLHKSHSKTLIISTGSIGVQAVGTSVFISLSFVIFRQYMSFFIMLVLLGLCHIVDRWIVNVT